MCSVIVVCKCSGEVGASFPRVWIKRGGARVALCGVLCYSIEICVFGKRDFVRFYRGMCRVWR